MKPLFLIEFALEAVKKSYAPYSNFHVGAALLTKDGQVFTGCNIENGAYSLSLCAERVAFAKAISEGVTEFEAIAIVGKEENEFKESCFPCGVCRQVMAEFCEPSFKIYLGNDKSTFETYTLGDLLPKSFKL